jgi:ribokinase
MAKLPRVLVIGSANMDFTVAVPHLPGDGETVIGGTLSVSHGGKGANQAVAARRLGADVRFVGCVGQDAQGEQVRDQLFREGIPTDTLAWVESAATGVALIVVDEAGRNQIAVAAGANHQLVPARAREHAALFGGSRVLLCQLEIPLETVEWALAEGKRKGLCTILNPAPAQPLPDGVLALVECLTPNAREAEQLTGVRVDGPAAAAAAAHRLIAKGARRVIVTLGTSGALYCDGAQAVHYPAFSVQAVDTVGAGDAFNGGLAAGLAAGGSWHEAIPLASAAAALACTKRGAMASLPQRAEVEAFMRGFKT